MPKPRVTFEDLMESCHWLSEAEGLIAELFDSTGRTKLAAKAREFSEHYKRALQQIKQERQKKKGREQPNSEGSKKTTRKRTQRRSKKNATTD